MWAALSGRNWKSASTPSWQRCWHENAARPVKLMLSREETMLAWGTVPMRKMTLKAGVKKDGTLTALQLTNVYTPGAYSARRHGRVPGPGTL